MLTGAAGYTTNRSAAGRKRVRAGEIVTSPTVILKPVKEPSIKTTPIRVIET